MPTRIEVKPEVLTWAILRADLSIDEFIAKNPNVGEWLDKRKLPTVKQLEDFARKVFVPFGYLLLATPPEESIPIPYFRTNKSEQDDKIHINIRDTILDLQRRQNWLSDYLKDNEHEKLKYVGRFKNTFDVAAIVSSIREVLGLGEDWATSFSTWNEAKNHLADTIESIGVIVILNGIVGNNTRRVVPIEQCRGFVLVDDYAPFMFINNADWMSAQIFTIVHELAHIWTGHSAGFDFRKFMPADDPVERLCDQVAAEFLVPEKLLLEMSTKDFNFKKAARRFKVSEIVVARRFLDLGLISKGKFFEFYNEYRNINFESKKKKASGGDFFLTAKRRVSLNFAAHIKRALKSGALLHTDAYSLTNLKGDTFTKFLNTHI